MDEQQSYNKKKIIPQWLRRELAVFGGMIVESSKFIFVSFLVFGNGIFGDFDIFGLLGFNLSDAYLGGAPFLR